MLELKRKIYDRLLQWKNSSNGETAVLVEGARRVGKSHIAQKFGNAEYKSCLLIDFSNISKQVLEVFENDAADYDLFFNKLSAFFGVKLYHRESLIIFDEVQMFPQARQLIKHLVADGRYDYLETGSLITLKQNVENIVIPSEEECITMHPLDFEEFLWAMGDETTAPFLYECFEKRCPLGDALHRKVMNLFRQYMLVGGMPQAVVTYVETKDFVMDNIMSKMGLSGKAFLPMVLGFGCTVPAIMATRALEKEKDRKKTILVIPFMSCSARLPIYVLLAGCFFGKYAMAAAFSMYVIGLFMAILVSLIIGKLDQAQAENNLLIELPEYKTPNARTIGIYVWEKVKDYLTKAGTTIFIASIILWFLLNFNLHGMTEDVAESFGAIIGRFLVPILAPAGLGMWQIGVALISGISAKEVVVSSFSVLFGIGNINSAVGMAEMAQVLEQNGFGALNAYCLMLFCLLYVPCAATIGTIRKETHSWKWTFGMIGFQLVLAWGVALVVYQIGRGLFML